MLPDKIDLKLRDLKNEIYENKFEIKKWTIQEVKRTALNKYESIESKREFLTGTQSYWDNTGKIFFFQHELKLPQNINKDNLYLHLDISGECTLFINGEVYRGINEKDIKLPEFEENYYKFKILATHDVHLSVRHQRLFNIPYPPHIFRGAFLFNKNKNIEKFYVLLKNIKKTIEVLSNKKEKLHLQNLLENSLNKVDFYSHQRSDFINSIENSYNDLTNKLKNTDNQNLGEVYLLAHSHLDLAFKWTVTDSLRKLERTISTTLNLMDQYDNYYYLQSQAILYDYLKKLYPDLFNKLKKKQSEGQFIGEGSFWNEADINLPNGESLIRQILYGKKFYKKHFKQDTKVAWLPDCFGFSAILPQILNKSEINYFLTAKLQWNETNQFPYNLFQWEGLDGSQINSYLLSDEYGGNLEPKKINKAWESRKQKDIDEVLSLYGFGDGGGGNNEIQLNNYQALDKIPYLPQIKTGHMQKHLENIFDKKDLPTWKGELYLEKHRGTYTSQADLKKYNRKLEFRLRNLELLYSIAKVNGYQTEHGLEKNWKTLLKNQFHDILPGSCVHDVYLDAVQDYEDLKANLAEIENDIFQFISNIITTNDENFFLFNPLTFKYDSLIELKLPQKSNNITALEVDAKKYPVQKENDSIYFKLDDFKSLSFKKIKLLDNGNEHYQTNLSSNRHHLENNYLKLSLDKKGQIKSIYDKENELEYIPKGSKANQLKLYDDKSTYFDAWDISISEQNKKVIDDITSIKVNNTGPYYHSIKIKRNFYNSTITQEIIMYDDYRKIDFKTYVDWQENQKLLKTVFPINIKNSQALFDLSMGHIKRANYKNTAWEKAKTEVPAHKWVNLNNNDISVSLLNDCKYGHQVDENVINLTLLKSGIFPDPQADLGEHEFTYSLLLSPQPKDIINIEQKALMMNNKPTLIQPSEKKEKNNNKRQFNKPFDIINDNVTLDAFKTAENKNGYIMRVHEIKGISSNLEIAFYQDIKEIEETNLIENKIKTLNPKNNKIQVKIDPFEIKTFKVVFV